MIKQKYFLSRGTELMGMINIDNGGTLTDICVIDGDCVHHTKTLTTPYDLSQCFFTGLRKASQVIYGEERLGDLLHQTDYIRYSSTQDSNAMVEKKGQRIGLILGRGHAVDVFRNTSAAIEMFDVLVGSRVENIDTELGDEEYEVALARAVNSLAAHGATRHARNDEREARKKRGIPYKDFVAE